MVFYPVDPDPTTGKRNKELLTILDITSTPTLYINGKKYSGRSAFELVKQMKTPQPKHNQYHMKQQSNMQSSQLLQSGNEHYDLMGTSELSSFNENFHPEKQDVDALRGENTRNTDDMMRVEKALELALQEREHEARQLGMKNREYEARASYERM
jgi:hypothetical protein